MISRSFRTSSFSVLLLSFLLSSSVDEVQAFPVARCGSTSTSTSSCCTAFFRRSKSMGLPLSLQEGESSPDNNEDQDQLGRASNQDDYQGSIDWDAEWKKVVQNQNQPAERPGKDFYKSEAQIAAIKTLNQATSKVNEAASQVVPSIPSWRSLQGDWKFWIGILVLISVGLSLLSAAPQASYYDAAPAPQGGGSYYI